MTACRLALLLALALGIRLLFFTGLRGSDDLRYAALARADSEGAPAIPQGFYLLDFSSTRAAFTAAIALGLRVGGLSEAALLAYPMACSLGTVAVVFLLADRWLGAASAWGAGLVAACLPGCVLSASSLYPDAPQALWISVSLALLWGAPEWRRWGRPAAATAGLAFALAIHHKETSVLLLPCLAWLALTSRRRSLAVWTLLALILELVFAWGGVFPRQLLFYLTSTLGSQATHALTSSDPTLGPPPALSARLLWSFPSILFNPIDLGGFSMWRGVAWLALGGAWLAFRDRSRPLMACAAWSLLGFLALNFAGIPWRGYFPVHPVSPRYLALLMPPVVLLAGAFAAQLWARLPWPARWVVSGLALGGTLVLNEMAATPNRDFARALRLSEGVLRLHPGAEVWTDRRTAEGLRFFLGGDYSFHDLGEASGIPPGAFVVLNGPKLRSLNQSPLVPSAGWTLMASRQVLGAFGRGKADPNRWVQVFRLEGGRPGKPSLPSAQPPPGITPRQQVVAALVSVGLILFIFELVRRRRLREEHSWLWMLSGGVILLFAVCYPALRWVTSLIGAGLPTSTLFFFGFFFLMLICIHYAVKISTLTVQMKNLMQELAMLKERMDREDRSKP